MSTASFAAPPPPARPPTDGPFGPFGTATFGGRRPARRFLVTLAASLLVGVVEVMVLIAIGRWIGPGWTILFMLATSALGVWLLRREGARSWRAFRAAVEQRRPPGPSATEGLLVLVGGILMVVPGFITDLVGGLLVAPPTRRLAGRWAQARLTRRLTPSAATSLFGPRTVRVRTGQPQSPPSQPMPTATTEASAGPADGGEPIEGEVIDPR